MSSLCREETPYNWEGEYREAHGGGGRWGSGELWGELPCMDEVRSFKAEGPFEYFWCHSYSARFNNQPTRISVSRGEAHQA
jgi:hypothetical protein